MTREEMLTAMIQLYGFEHEVVIEFAKLIENPNFPDEALATLVLVHQECPITIEEDE